MVKLRQEKKRLCPGAIKYLYVCIFPRIVTLFMWYINNVQLPEKLIAVLH